MVMSHYVGSSSASTNATNFMRRCTSELRLHYLDSELDDLTSIRDLVDFTRVTQAFRAAVALGPSIIVIDGVNDLGAAHDVPAFEVKEMDWLPAVMPSSCRVIITTTKADITYKSLSKRKDVYCTEVPQLFHVKSRRSLLTEYVGANYTHFLDEGHVTKICSSELAHLPLFYVALANELRVLGAHKSAQRHLDSYLHASTLADLWTAIIRRWTQDYGWLRPVSRNLAHSINTQVSRDRANSGWVADALRLLSVSRDGLTEAELLGALRIMGYGKNHEVTTAHWELFRLVTENALVHTSSGLLTFSHQAVRGAVECALLGSLTSPSQERTVSPFQETWERHKQQCHAVLVRYFSQQPLTARVVEELPWQQRKSGDWDGLCAAVSEPGIFVKLVGNRDEERRRADLVSYWKVLKAKGRRPEEALRRMAGSVQEKLSDDGNGSDSIVTSERDAGSARSKAATEELSAIEELCLKSHKDHFSQIQVAAILYFAWMFLREIENGSAADSILVTSYKLAYPVASVRDLSLMCRIQEALGDLCSGVSDAGKAVFWYGEALKTAGESTRVTNKVLQVKMIFAVV